MNLILQKAIEKKVKNNDNQRRRNQKSFRILSKLSEREPIKHTQSKELKSEGKLTRKVKENNEGHFAKLKSRGNRK